MNCVFLDIDGVLNSMPFYENKSTRELLDHPFDPENVLQLKKIIDATGARIVLTSSWRGGWDKDPANCTWEGKLLNELFDSIGISVYDKTVVSDKGRAWEIKEYLRTSPEKIQKYVIIDDNDFEWKKNRLARHVVLTSFNEGGLKEAHALKAIRLLHRKRFLPW